MKGAGAGVDGANVRACVRARETNPDTRHQQTIADEVAANLCWASPHPIVAASTTLGCRLQCWSQDCRVP
jgi:hypothetical protein